MFLKLYIAIIIMSVPRPRDNIQGITNPVIKRLVIKAGIPETGSMAYEEIRGVLKVHLVKVLRNVITIAAHNKTARVQVRHVKQALEGLGMESYARLCGQTKTRDRKVGKNQIKVANGVTVKDCARKAPKACTADVNNKSAGRADKGDNTRYAMEVLQSQITCHMFPIKTFSLLVREVAQTYKNGLQFTPEAIDMIQTSAEAYLLDLIQKSAEILASRRARRLQPKDIQAVRNILDGN